MAVGSASVLAGEPSAAPGKAVLKTYSCPAGTADAIASRLEQQYPSTSGVRIVADTRASQLLVIAAPQVQSEIGERLKQESASAVPTAAGPQPAPAPAVAAPAEKSAGSTAGLKQDLQLWNISGRELEAGLLRTLGERLNPTTGTTPEASTYRLALPSGEGLLISVDRQKNRATLEGGGIAVGAATQLIHALDHPQQLGQNDIGLCALSKARKTDVAMVAAAVQNNQGAAAATSPAAPNPAAPAVTPPSAAAPQVAPTTPPSPAAAPPGNGPAPDQEGLVGPVQIQILDGLDVLVVRGHQRDVKRVMEIIQQIEQLSTETKPTIQVLPLEHVESVALAGLLTKVYAEAFATRLGSLSVTALGKPNAVLLVGRAEPVEMAVDLARRLDQPVPPDTQFQIFHLKSIPAEQAKQNIDAIFLQQVTSTTGAQQPRPQQTGTDTGSLAPHVTVVSDFRSNSLIVRGSPRELAEVAALVARMDGGVNASTNQVRVFRLRNSLAETLAPVLQDAITGQMYGQKSQRGQFSMAQAMGGQQRQDFERKSSRLQFVAVDARGQQVLSSGILTDAQVTADTRTNAVIVTASAESMPLIAALIQELDQPAEAEAQVKVFTLVNGDASAMSQMLEQIFGTTTTTNVNQGMAVRTGVPADQTSLVGLKLAVDVRTNSIIVTGSSGALTVVEAILMRLDSSDVRNRRTSVYRLKNSPATDVATAINQYLTNERQVQQLEPGLLSAFEQIEQEVVVVAEPVSNSLIISATPRFYDEILKVVTDIDQRPPMVMIQVLIAEVALNKVDQFGVELGLQDKVLFNRSNIIGSGDNSTLVPGFQFNSSTLGNSGSARSLATADTVGGQSITNLGVGRVDPTLGIGGLVLSASSDTVSLLIRALEQDHRLQILSRPQVMTMDNQTAQIVVGQRVPTITASQLTQFGTINSITYNDVGIIMTVTPRVSPDRLVVMEIQAEKSKLEPIADGIPIAIGTDGVPIRSPIIDTTTTRTVVSALDGQTVVLGGMIAKSTERLKNKVPYLADVPVLGHLFQYKSDTDIRTELLIIMTPRIVTTAQDAETIRRVESARMHWCLCDVMALQDGDGLGKNGPTWYDGNTAVVYPDLDPTLKTMQELVPLGDKMAPLANPEMINTPQPAAPANGPAPSGQVPQPPAPGFPGHAPKPGLNTGVPRNPVTPTLAPRPAQGTPVPQPPAAGNPAAGPSGAGLGPTTEVRILPRGQAVMSPAGAGAQDTWGQLQPAGVPNGPQLAPPQPATNIGPSASTQNAPVPEAIQPVSYVRYGAPYQAPAYPVTNR